MRDDFSQALIDDLLSQNRPEYSRTTPQPADSVPGDEHPEKARFPPPRHGLEQNVVPFDKYLCDGPSRPDSEEKTD